jgi:hypothetical protein
MNNIASLSRRDVVPPSISNHLLLELYEYIYPPAYKIMDWIPLDTINVSRLLSNPNPLSIRFLLRNLDIIPTSRDRYFLLCKSLKYYRDNIDLIKNDIHNLDDKCWEEICSNIPLFFSKATQTVKNSIMTLLDEKYSKLNNTCWFNLCKSQDTAIVDFIKKRNTNPEGVGERSRGRSDTRRDVVPPTERSDTRPVGAVERSDIDLQSMCRLCGNPSFISYIEDNIDNLPRQCWYWICGNPNPAIFKIIEQNIDKLDTECWTSLSYHKDPKVFEILEKNIDKVNWYSLSQNITNPKLPIFLKKYLSKLDICCWKNICFNTNRDILYLLQDNIDHIPWPTLCKNHHPDIITFIQQNIEKLDIEAWLNLCENPNAVKLIEDNIEKIRNLPDGVRDNGRQDNMTEILRRLCLNPSKEAVRVISKYIEITDDFSCWENLCLNSNDDIVSLLEKNISKLNNYCWTNLYRNFDNKNVMNLLSEYPIKLFQTNCNSQYLLSNPNIFIIDERQTRFEKNEWIKAFKK